MPEERKTLPDMVKLVVLALLAVIFAFAICHEIKLTADCHRRGGVVVRDAHWNTLRCVRVAR